MKKILFILCVIVAANINAQDLTRLRSMTNEEALSFAEEITNIARDDWKLYKTDEEKRVLELWYIPTNADEAMLKKIKDVGISTSGIDKLIVVYEAFYEGQDLDLEIEGVKRYRFLSMTLKFLDAFPIWEKYFLNGATIENVRNNVDHNRKDETNERIWMYKFKPETSPYWTIYKFY